MSENAVTTGPAYPEGRNWRRAFLWLALLAPFFYLSYGLANWLAGRRDDVPAMVFAWEHEIPFIAWSIVPYWSVNLFYGASLFLCANTRELDTHGRRLLSAQIIAVTFFILTPLAFTFTQPSTDGLPGLLFAALSSFDRPFNQAPSLHIGLLIILWVLYARHTPRLLLWPLHIWFALVGISVLTTYQHHFIDIPTGTLLGFFCLWLWPDNAASPLPYMSLARDKKRWKLAGFYTLGAALCSSAALAIGGMALWLFWPAASLVMVAANYAIVGAAGFQKRSDGSMSLAARWLLAPYLLGAWTNSRLWTRSRPQPSQVTNTLWIGRYPTARNLRTGQFSAVVDLTAELPAPDAEVTWRTSPMLDLVSPTSTELCDAAQLIENAQASGSVLVVCALGYSRSASAVAVWLLASGRAADVDAAINQIQAARPQVRLHHHRSAIAAAAQSCDLDAQQQ